MRTQPYDNHRTGNHSEKLQFCWHMCMRTCLCACTHACACLHVPVRLRMQLCLQLHCVGLGRAPRAPLGSICLPAVVGGRVGTVFGVLVGAPSEHSTHTRSVGLVRAHSASAGVHSLVRVHQLSTVRECRLSVRKMIT